MEIIRRIRYARAQRFGHPVPERELSFSPAGICPQRVSRLGGAMGPGSSSDPLTEDCLHLSIFTPSRLGRKPVMVWICGGTFIKGSGEFKRYDATKLCTQEDLVIVNVSYRVGVLGFLYQPEKDAVNLGIEDQICALEWVREHIAEYGGDPSRVCVCGQSAGAYCIASIIGRGRADLFESAILFSAPLLFKPNPKTGEKIRQAFLKQLELITGDCTGPDDCDIETLLNAQEATLKSVLNPLPFCAVGERFMFEGAPLPRRVLLTTQKDDARPFVPMRILTAPATSVIFGKPSDGYAKALKEMGCDATRMVLDWKPEGSKAGACHTLEVPFLLGDWESWSPANMLQGLTEDAFNERGTHFRSLIADFIKGR